MQLDSCEKDLKESKAALVFAFSNTSRRQDAPGDFVGGLPDIIAQKKIRDPSPLDNSSANGAYQ